MASDPIVVFILGDDGIPEAHAPHRYLIWDAARDVWVWAMLHVDENADYQPPEIVAPLDVDRGYLRALALQRLEAFRPGAQDETDGGLDA